MSNQVIKGQKVDVTKNRPDIKNLVVDLSWHVKTEAMFLTTRLILRLAVTL